MRKFYLTIAMAATAIGMQAQSWTAPTLNISTEAVPDSAYLYHVGQEKFFTKGTTWGTHAALTDKASDALMYKFELQQDGTTYKLHAPKAANTGYLGRTGTDLYTDYNNQAEWSTEYSINKIGEYFTITTAATSVNFGAEADATNDTDYNTYKMGWNPANDDVDKDGQSLGTNVGVFMIDPTLEGIQTDWAFVLVDEVALYNAKQALYNTLNEAVEVDANTDEAAAVYNNPASTLEQINEANAKLTKTINDIKQGNASEDNPVDMTSAYMVNADFSQGSANGWTLVNNVLVYNADTKPNGDCNVTELNGGETITHSVAAWISSSTHLANDSVYQTLKDVKPGKYGLKASIVAQHGADMPVGVYLFANGLTTSQMQVQHDENLWAELVAAGTTNQLIMHPELEIIHAGGDLTVGLALNETNCNWVYASKFQLICYGETEMNAYALALTQIANEAKPLTDDVVNYYSVETFNTLDEKVEAAFLLAATPDASNEEMQAATDELKQLIVNVKAEIEAYKKLNTLVETVKVDIDRYAGIESLSSLEDKLDEYEGAYIDREATTEEINTWVAAYDQFIVDGVKAAIATATPENPIEITVLANNMNFATNSTTEGWTIEAGNISGHGNYAVSYNVAEMWNNTFKATQILKDMPAGSYKLTAKAFYRTGGNAEGYDAYVAASDKTEGILTYLTVAGGQAPVVNQAAGAIEAAEAPYTGYVETAEGSGIWLPNNMQAASWAFAQDTYLSEAKGYLTEQGDLTFGLYNNELTAGNAWSIWGDLRLFYCGTDNNALYEQMINISNQALALQDQASMIAEADNKLNEALGVTGDLDETSSEEEILAVINQLNEAIAYAEEGIQLIPQIAAAYDNYSLKMGDIESGDEAFVEMIGEIGNAVGAEEFESNEQIKGWLEQLPLAWTKYVQYDHLNATKEAPEDITAILVNPSFDQGTNDNNGAYGWTREFKTDGGHVGIASADQQEQSGFTYEFWKVEEFKLYQTVVGLAEGYYRVSANALYREGGHSDDAVKHYLTERDSVNDVSLFANTCSVKIANLYDEMYEESTGAEGEKSAVVDGKNYYVIGTQGTIGALFSEGKYMNTVDVFVKEGEALQLGLVLDGKYVINNWCLFDNFTLLYLGNGKENMPDAIEGVESNDRNTQSAIYDIAGRRVTKAVKGLYIINGKKVIK